MIGYLFHFSHRGMASAEKEDAASKLHDLLYNEYVDFCACILNLYSA